MNFEAGNETRETRLVAEQNLRAVQNESGCLFIPLYCVGEQFFVHLRLFPSFFKIFVWLRGLIMIFN